MKNFIKIFMLVLLMAGMFTVSAFATDYEVSDQVGFAEAMNKAVSGDTIILTDDTIAIYQMVPNSNQKDITIEGKENDSPILKFNDNDYQQDNYSGNITFKNLTIDSGVHGYSGLNASGTATYEGCTIVGEFYGYGSKIVFNGCQFSQNGDAYCIWTYGCPDVTFNTCTFNSAGKAILVYNEGYCGTAVHINNCSLNASVTKAGKAAIEIDSTYLSGSQKHEIYIDSATTESGFDANSLCGNSLWNNKFNNVKQKQGDLTYVYVGGVEVYPNPAPVNPNPNPAPVAPVASNTYEVPSTADNSNMPLWGGLLLAFAAVALLTGKKRRA